MTTPHPNADLLRAIADGKQMQELDFPGINHPGNWCDCDADRALNRISRGVEQYIRIKPETVLINGIECPAPMRVAPAAQPPALTGDLAEPRDDSDRIYDRPVGYLPAYELSRLHSGHGAQLRSAKFGPSALDGDVPVYLESSALALVQALIGAQRAINSMKVEAETAAQGDEQMMLDACEQISNEGLEASLAIQAALSTAAQPAVQQWNGPTMDDAIAAGDGTLHGAIDHWMHRALDAERGLLYRGLVLEEAAKACEEREQRSNREDVRATCRLCAKDIRALAVVNQSLTSASTAHPAAPAAQPPAAPQEELREDASYESMNLAVMVLSDCGHSSNYTPLLERVAGRIDRHVERLLTAQRADLTRLAQAEPAHPTAGIWVPTELAERVQETMVNDVKQYPPLPASFGHVHSDGNYCQDMEPSHESWPIDIYTAVQMRAYVDADRAMRAARDAEDAAHIKNLCELVRMPNAEYVADAHNAAVKYLRLRARAKQ